REDRYFVDGIAARRRETHGHVPRFVHGRGVTLVLFHDERLAFVAHRHAVARELDVRGTDRVRTVARGQDGRFVEQAREIRTGVARGRAGHRSELDLGRERDLPRVNAENLFATSGVG